MSIYKQQQITLIIYVPEAQICLDFQGSPLTMALEMNLPGSNSLRPAPYKELEHKYIFIVNSTKYVHIKSTTVYAPRRNWDSPNPFLASECSPPPRNMGEGAHQPAGGGLAEVPIPTRGIHCGTLYMQVLCGKFRLLKIHTFALQCAQQTFGQKIPIFSSTYMPEGLNSKDLILLIYFCFAAINTNTEKEKFSGYRFTYIHKQI